MKFFGKNLWITGASSGIGRAVAIQLSLKQCHLILSSRNKEDLEKVASICRKNGSTTTVVPFDLSNSSSIDQAAKIVLSTVKQIDGLYHFGGISQRAYANDTAIAIDRKIFEVNFFGTIDLTKKVLPTMISRGGGQIGVTSSIVGKFGFPYRSAYSASKHALHGFFESVRSENIDNKISISMIIPGRVSTNISMNAIDQSGNAHNIMDEGQEKRIIIRASSQNYCKEIRKGKERNTRWR